MSTDHTAATGADSTVRETVSTAADNAGQLLGHPRGLFLLFVVEMWERFSYYGMRALLVLYLISQTSGANPGRGWQEGDANLLYGWYTGLAYLVPLLGGFLADRFMGTHRSMVVGALIITLGHVVLAISGLGTLDSAPLGMSLFIFGLALIILGTGFFKPCVSVMVGQLYAADDPRRDGAFTIFYMGINLGAFLCAFVCGTLGEQVGWHWGFGSAAVGMIAGLCIYLWGRPVFLQGIGEPPPAAKNTYMWPSCGAAIAVALAVMGFYHFGGFAGLRLVMSKLMENPTVATSIIATLVIATLAGVSWFVRIQTPEDRGPTVAIFLMILFNVFFWIAFEQAGSTLNIFAKDNTSRAIGSWEVPATWFQSINPFAIFLFAPLFAALWEALGRRGRDPSQPVKVALGLFLLGAGYVVMVFAALRSQTVQVSMFWLTATYLLHTLGELCLSPTGLSFATKAAPARFVSLVMGFWFISSFLANLGGGLIASYVEGIEKGTIRLPWYVWFRLGGRADYFLMFVITSFAAGIAALLLTPAVKKMLHGRG